MSAQRHDQDPGDAAARADAARCAAARRLLVPRSGVDSPDHLCALALRLLGADLAQVSVRCADEVVVSRFGTAGKTGSRLEAPVTSADGVHVVGALTVLAGADRVWTEEDRTTLDVLAAGVAAELERAAALVERQGLQQRLAVALDSAGIGSWELDLDSREFRGDARLLEMFGMPGDSQEVRISAYAIRILPEDRPRVSRSLERSVAEGSDYVEEYRVRQPDGSVRWVAARGRPMYDAEGGFMRLVGSAFDTTDQHVSADRAEATSGLLALVASASEVLASSLEPEDAVRSFARLVVPTLADWSVVSLVNSAGVLEDVDWWHRDPDRQDLLTRFALHRLEGRNEVAGSLLALRSRQPFVLTENALDYALKTLRAPEAAQAVTQLGLGSVAVFPLLTDAGDAIGLITLARDEGRPAFSAEQLSAADDLSRRASISLENARSFGREREMSEQLQRSLLTEPVQPDHVEVVVRYTPATKAAQVGGDWYDAFAQDDGATVLVVGDVVGHDSVAAAVMGQLRSMLRGVAVTSGARPAQLLADLDRVLVTLRMWTNASVVVARVESEPGADEMTLRWSNAGHPPPLLVRPSGEVTVLEDHDLLLGVDPEQPRTEQAVTLAPGSTVLLYTDGLVERRGEDIDVSIERLRVALVDVQDQPLAEAVDRLLADLLPREPDDDVVVLAMRVTS